MRGLSGIAIGGVAGLAFLVVCMLIVHGSAELEALNARAVQEPEPPTAAIEAFEQASILTVCSLALKQDRIADWDAVRDKALKAMQDYATAELERLELPVLGFPTGGGDFELFFYSLMPEEALWHVEDMTSITAEERAEALTETGEWALTVYAIARECGASHAALVEAWSRGHEAAEYTTVKVRVIDWTREE